MAKKSQCSIDDFVDSALKAAESQFGAERCYVAASHESRQRVLPIKHLSLRWLIAMNGWPLGRVSQSGGPFGTHKSSFIFQLIAWYLEAGGFAAFIDTEYKTSGSLMRSIIDKEFMDRDNPKSRRLHFTNASTVNDWQRTLSMYRQELGKLNSKPSFPIFMAVDSMMGAGGETGLEHIKTEGDAPGRGYSDEALLIKQYMQNFPNTLLGWPITVHFSHHEKPAMGGMGMSRTGGKAPDFYATLDMQFRRGGVTCLGKSMEINRTNFDARAITLDVRKNALASDIGKKLTVLFCWRFDKVSNQQVSWWDWTGATAMVLANEAKLLKDIIDVNHETRQTVGEVFWSDCLGISHAAAVPASEFGTIIESHDLRSTIETALNIQNLPVFDGTYDV